MRSSGAVLLASLALGGPGRAWAADVDVFQPSGALATGRGTLQGEAPGLGVTGFSGGLLAGYANAPVVRRLPDGTVDPEVAALVPLYLQGSWTQENLLRVDVQVPVYALVDAPLTDFSGPAVGDLRLQATLPIGPRSDAFRFALVPRVDVPTGSDRALVSNGLAVGAVATAGGALGKLGWVANLGAHIASNEPLEPGAPGLGSRAMALGGAWWNVSDAVRMGAEADLGIGLASGDGGTNNTAMAHGFAQAMLKSGLGFTLGGGTGLIGGVGIPRYRLFAALSWTTLRHDRDLDGVVDDDDACPDEAEDADGFADLDGCPDLDNDEDGLVDVGDLCPNQPEDHDTFDDEDGCPDPDNDEDGLADVEDRCPLESGPEVAMGCPDTDGDGIADPADACPLAFGVLDFQGCADTDGDGIPDPDDACPDQPRRIDDNPQNQDGCPHEVFLTDREIKLEQRIEFYDGRSKLKKPSEAVLDEVAQILEGAPHLARIEVQGHTDSVGPADYNQKLSQARADAVVRHLVERGIARERLVAQGYGETTPLFTNRTASGRTSNRRVQFIVLDVVAVESPPAADDVGDGAVTAE